MNKFKAVLCAALSVCIVSVPIASSVVFNAGAENVESLQERIDNLGKKSEEYQNILNETETDISEKEAYGEALVNKINVINEKVILTRQAISSLESDIALKQQEIDKDNADIDGQVKALGERLSIIYMAGSASNLEILLGAKNFGDFIDKISLVKTLSDYDKKMIDDINKQLEVVEKEKKALESDKAEKEDQEASLNKDIEDLNKLIKENEAVLSELTAKSEQARAALLNSNSESSQLEAQIAKYFAEQEEAARKAAAQQQKQSSSKKSSSSSSSSTAKKSSTVETQPADDDDDDEPVTEPSYDDDYVTPTPASSGYTWPCPGFYYLSSLWNEDRTTYNHGAIDIAGGGILGAPVVAADSGTVAYTCTYCTHNWGKSGSCGCGGGYGNYVWIDHGNGKETIYAHLTSVTVNPGDYVTKGQLIGYVGSTGYSTGPHLHFECRYNGVKYNPMTEF